MQIGEVKFDDSLWGGQLKDESYLEEEKRVIEMFGLVTKQIGGRALGFVDGFD